MGRMRNIVSGNFYYELWYLTVRVTKLRVGKDVLTKMSNLKKKKKKKKKDGTNIVSGNPYYKINI